MVELLGWLRIYSWSGINKKVRKLRKGLLSRPLSKLLAWSFFWKHADGISLIEKVSVCPAQPRLIKKVYKIRRLFYEWENSQHRNFPKATKQPGLRPERALDLCPWKKEICKWKFKISFPTGGKYIRTCVKNLPNCNWKIRTTRKN